MSDLVGNPEDRFSHNEAHFISVLDNDQFTFLNLRRAAFFSSFELGVKFHLF